jgi:hypothetical protein
VWRLSDGERRGFLSKEEFFLALRLVALARLSRPLSIQDASPLTAPRTPCSPIILHFYFILYLSICIYLCMYVFACPIYLFTYIYIYIYYLIFVCSRVQRGGRTSGVAFASSLCGHAHATAVAGRQARLNDVLSHRRALLPSLSCPCVSCVSCVSCVVYACMRVVCVSGVRVVCVSCVVCCVHVHRACRACVLCRVWHGGR